MDLTTTERKAPYRDLVWDMIQTTYEPLGGFKSSHARDPQHFLENTELWRLETRGDDIIAVAVYRLLFGRKAIGGASNGSKEGKKALLRASLRDFQIEAYWGEISGVFEDAYMKRIPIGDTGLARLTSAFLGPYMHNSQAEALIERKIHVLDDDGMHYHRRLCDGTMVRKMIAGKPHSIVVNDHEYRCNSFLTK